MDAILNARRLDSDIMTTNANTTEVEGMRERNREQGTTEKARSHVWPTRYRTNYSEDRECRDWRTWRRGHILAGRDVHLTVAILRVEAGTSSCRARSRVRKERILPVSSERRRRTLNPPLQCERQLSYPRSEDR